MFDYRFLVFLCMLFSFNLIAQEKSIFDEFQKTEKSNITNTCTASFVALNKITTKSKNISLKEGETNIFDNLNITLSKSFANKDKKEFGALISVFEQKIDSDPVLLFQGWIISPRQHLSTMNHPIYEILMVGCK